MSGYQYASAHAIQRGVPRHFALDQPEEYPLWRPWDGMRDDDRPPSPLKRFKGMAQQQASPVIPYVAIAPNSYMVTANRLGNARVHAQYAPPTLDAHAANGYQHLPGFGVNISPIAQHVRHGNGGDAAVDGVIFTDGSYEVLPRDAMVQRVEHAYARPYAVRQAAPIHHLLQQQQQQELQQLQHQQQQRQQLRMQEAAQLTAAQQLQQQQLSSSPQPQLPLQLRSHEWRSSGEDLRRNCDYCVRKKVKCNGELPCHLCRRKQLNCTYSIKQKPGPKVRSAAVRAAEARGSMSQGGGSGGSGGEGASERVLYTRQASQSGGGSGYGSGRNVSLAAAGAGGGSYVASRSGSFSGSSASGNSGPYVIVGRPNPFSSGVGLGLPILPGQGMSGGVTADVPDDVLDAPLRSLPPAPPPPPQQRPRDALPGQSFELLASETQPWLRSYSPTSSPGESADSDDVAAKAAAPPSPASLPPEAPAGEVGEDGSEVPQEVTEALLALKHGAR